MAVRGIDLAPQISGSDSGGMTIINSVAEMKTTSGSEPLIVYCEETAGIYRFCDNCDFSPDDDLVIATGSGGTTRWELLQKMTRALGDTGWIDSDNATISAVSATKVRLTITTEAAIGIRGIRHPVPAGDYDLTLTGSPGIKFIHLLAGMTLASRDTLWDFDAEVPVMIAYWSGTAIVAAPQTEFHGIRDNIWHKYTHTYVGLQYRSGLSFTGSVQTDNNVDPGATETVYNLWSTSGVVQDEDIQATPGAGQWAQTLGSGLTEATAAIFNHFYFNGSAIVSQAAMADRAPFIHTGANTPPQWNNGGTLTDAITGDFIVYHYFANPMVGGWGVFARPHNAKYTSLAAALAASPTQLTWTNYAELKHIYTAIFRVNTGWANSHRCKLVSLRDFRTVAGTPVAATNPTSHSSLTGLELAGAGVTHGHINDQPQTIAGAKTFDTAKATTALVFVGNGAIPAGAIGERLRANSGSISMPATNTVKVVTSVTLTPGLWDLTGICFMDIASFSAIRLQISLTDSTTTVEGSIADDYYGEGTASLSGGYTIAIVPSYRIGVTVNTVFNMTMKALYTGSPSGLPLSGRITATRARGEG